MKQTAVQWLENELDFLDKYMSERGKNSLFEKAKQMDKEQHGNTWDAAIQAHEDRGGVISRSLCDFEQYYNETYGAEK